MNIIKYIRAVARSIIPVQAPRRPRLLVDVSILWHRDAGTGIQRVVKALGDRLVNVRGCNYDVQFVAATRKRGYRFLVGGAPGETPRPIATRRVQAGEGDIFLGLDLCSRILPRHERQLRRWRSRGVKIAIVVYDLLPARHPGWFGEQQAAYFVRWLHVIRRNADQALCISTTVAKDLAAWLQEQDTSRDQCLDKIAITSFPLGGDLRYARPSGGIGPGEAATLARLAGQRFILMVGTIEPRKGHAVALDAFDRIIAEQGNATPILVIVGRSGWKAKDVEERIRNHEMFGRSIIWFDDASDELLDMLYRTCFGVFFPTFAEGFGLPIAEAIAYGRPVLARDLPVFREMESHLVSYFPNDSAPNLAESIMNWLDNVEKKSERCQQDIPTWEKSCEVLLRSLQILT